MTFDETKVERDPGGKFSEKAGSAPEVSLAASAKPKLRKVNKGTGYYGKRLETADVRIGEPEELVEGSGWMRTPLYLDGQHVGHISERTRTPTQKVSRGVSRSLKPRTEFLVELKKEYGGVRESHPSRTRSIFTALDRAIDRGDL